MFAVCNYFRGGNTLKISKRPVDWNCLEETTVTEMNQLIKEKGTGYVNPEYTLELMDPTTYGEFARNARRLQALWIQRLIKQIGGSAIRKYMKSQPLLRRKLLYTGLMIVEGKIQMDFKWEGKRTKTLLVDVASLFDTEHITNPKKCLCSLSIFFLSISFFAVLS